MEVITPEVVDSKLPDTAIEVHVTPPEVTKAIKSVKSSGIEETKGDMLLKLFTPYFKNMAEVELQINSLNATEPTKADAAKAREIRLALRENRINSEKVRKKAKEGILIEGRLIDNLNGVVENISKPLEAKCEAIEKFEETQAKKRQQETYTARYSELKAYVTDVSLISSLPLDIMKEEAYVSLRDGYKASHERRIEQQRKDEEEKVARQAKEEEDRKEKARLDEEQKKRDDEENERIRLENEKLKADADARQKELDAANEKLRKEQADRDAKAKRIQDEQEEKLRKEREENDRLKKELQDKKDAEDKADRDRKAREEAEAKARLEEERLAKLAPEKDKLRKWVDSLTIPDIDTEGMSVEADRKADAINNLFQEFKMSAREMVEGIA